MWYVNASVFDWYHVRRYTGIVPLLAPGLAVLIAPLARTVVPIAVIAFLAWRYDLAVDGLRPLPGVAVPVRSAMARVADDLAAGTLSDPRAARARSGRARCSPPTRASGCWRANSSHVDLGGDDALLRIPEPARHLSAPTFEDGVAARWVTDRDARLALPIDAPAGLVLRLRARALETPEPQVDGGRLERRLRRAVRDAAAPGPSTASTSRPRPCAAARTCSSCASTARPSTTASAARVRARSAPPPSPS